MKDTPLPVPPHPWLRQMFSARTAIEGGIEGGIVRRNVTDVERLVGREMFMQVIRRRSSRVVENAGHFVIFCNAEPVHIHP
jgi:hypothetical protein